METRLNSHGDSKPGKTDAVSSTIWARNEIQQGDGLDRHLCIESFVSRVRLKQ